MQPRGAVAAAGVRLAEAVPADDAARRELALLGVRRVAREAAAQRSGASAKRLSSLSATTARFLRSRAVAQLGSIRGSTSCLCSGQWAARLRLCVCVCHVRCARTHRPSGRCACVPLCHISPRARRPD